MNRWMMMKGDEQMDDEQMDDEQIMMMRWNRRFMWVDFDGMDDDHDGNDDDDDEIDG